MKRNLFYFRKYFKTLLLLMQVGIFFTYCRSSKPLSLLPANKVLQDSLVIFHETGLLESIETFNIKAPRRWEMEYRIVKLVPEGSFVQPGDTVVYFDMQPLKERMQKAQTELKKVRQGLTQTLEQNALALESQLRTIERLKMQLEIDSTRLANARFESKTTQEQFALELQKTRLQLQRAFKNLEAQKIINQTKERLQRIKIEQALIELNRVLLMKQEMKLVSDHAGVVIYPYFRSSGRRIKIKEGESVFPGQVVIQVANLQRMKAVVKLNEVDRQLIKPGQHVRLTVDAYPDTVFAGQIVKIDRVANREDEESTLKVYGVDVYLKARANFRLKPGLSVRAAIVLDTLQNAFRVPEWCLFNNGQPTWVVTWQNQKIAVDLITQIDGLAFVKGPLQTGMILKSKKTGYD